MTKIMIVVTVHTVKLLPVNHFNGTLQICKESFSCSIDLQSYQKINGILFFLA
jgi:hypothetical protein